MTIAPNWAHSFPENVDHTLLNWFDIHVAKTREPYNQPSLLEVTNDGGKLIASWSWEGARQAKKAEIVVSYGSTRPWHCWIYRYHYVLPAVIEGNTARAEVPVPEAGMEMLVYGNLTDADDVLVSTVPITVRPQELEIDGPTADLKLNTALVTDFSPEEMLFLARHGTPVAGKPDVEQKHAGGQSLRVEGAATVSMKLGHVPERDHRLSLWLKADKATTINVKVAGARPANWGSQAVDILRRRYPGTADIKYEDIKPPAYEAAVDVSEQWELVTLDCPFDGMPVEGYDLHITQPGGGATYWIDTIGFEPKWKRAE